MNRDVLVQAILMTRRASALIETDPEAALVFLQAASAMLYAYLLASRRPDGPG